MVQLQLSQIFCFVRNNMWPDLYIVGKTWRKRCMSSSEVISGVIFAM